MAHDKFYYGDSPGNLPGQQHLDTNPPTGGDMLKSVYDPDDNGKVNAAENADEAGHSTTSDEALKITGIDGPGPGKVHYYGTDLEEAPGFHSLLRQTSYGYLYDLWIAEGFAGDGTDFLLWLGLNIEFSEDGATSWHEVATGADKYVRFKHRATEAWSDAVRFSAYDVIIQYSADGITGWDTTVDPGDKFVRFSYDGGATFSTATQFTGSDMVVEYSADGSTGWTTTYTDEIYLRFSTDGGATFSNAVLFVGNPVQLGQLVDVDLITNPPTNGQALAYNATTGKWRPDTVSGGSDTSATLLIWQGI